jgi:hypothetical protein
MFIVYEEDIMVVGLEWNGMEGSPMLLEIMKSI